MTLPLDGIRIIDLSFIVAGPLASRLLCDFGADVVRIESRSRIDGARINPVRLYGELPGDANTNPDASGYFQDVNAGKRSCTLNLNSDAGIGLPQQGRGVSGAGIGDRQGIGIDEGEMGGHERVADRTSL